MDTVGLNLHIHTRHSHDAYITFGLMVRLLRKMGTTVFAITDHDTMDGAARYREWAARHPYLTAGMSMIPGEEVTCADGTHVIGLFLAAPVASRRGVVETVNAIRGQNGLVIFPHPCRNDGILNSKEKDAALPLGHFFEAFNGKAPHADNLKGLRALEGSALLPVGSSDAHYLGDLKKAQSVLPRREDPRDLLEAYRRDRKIRILGHPKAGASYDYFQHFYDMKKVYNPPRWIRKILWAVDPRVRNVMGVFKSPRLEPVLDSL